ncbi:MAG: hypothetical protein ACK55I_49750, partial [bacterium]
EAAAAAAVDDCALAVTAGDAADCEELTPLYGLLEDEEAEFLLNDLISKVSPVLLLYVRTFLVGGTMSSAAVDEPLAVELEPPDIAEEEFSCCF